MSNYDLGEIEDWEEDVPDSDLLECEKAPERRLNQ